MFLVICIHFILGEIKLGSIKGNKYKPFFQHLSDESQKLLLLYGNEITVPKKKILFFEGEESNDIYLIRSGQIRLSKMTIDNRQFYLHIKQKDDIVGEFSLFNELKSNMTAETITDATLVRFNKQELEALFSQNGEIAIAFIKIFARNTQSTQAKFSDLLLYGKTGAMYSTLIRFANSYGIKTTDGIKINMKLTNKDIAHFIGTSRETVNRMLNDLRRDEIIDLKGGIITIKDMEYLKGHLHCGKCPIAICTIA